MIKRIIPSAVLYAFAAFLAFFSGWALVRGVQNVREAIEAGQISVEENLYEIINFYMASCVQYFVYALLLAAAGIMLQRESRFADAASLKEVKANGEKESDGETESEEYSEPYEQTELEEAFELTEDAELTEDLEPTEDLESK